MGVRRKILPCAMRAKDTRSASSQGSSRLSFASVKTAFAWRQVLAVARRLSSQLLSVSLRVSAVSGVQSNVTGRADSQVFSPPHQVRSATLRNGAGRPLDDGWERSQFSALEAEENGKLEGEKFKRQTGRKRVGTVGKIEPLIGRAVPLGVRPRQARSEEREASSTSSRETKHLHHHQRTLSRPRLQFDSLLATSPSRHLP